METAQKFLKSTIIGSFWAKRSSTALLDESDIRLKKNLPSSLIKVSIPAIINVSFSQRGDVITVMVDLNEEIHCGRIVLETLKKEGHIVPYGESNAEWSSVNGSGETPMDGIYAWTFLPELAGDYLFRARYDANEPDCPFDSIGWTKPQSVLFI